MTPTIGSLFSGAGGLDLAVEEAFGGRTVWHCENEPAAAKVLAARWPGVPNLGDITAVDWFWVEPVDILCGGFPCQDVSAAGRRAGIHDGTRSGLWSYFVDAIAALHPQIVVIENVRGLLSAGAHRDMEPYDAAMGDGTNRPVLRAAGAVLGDLAHLGYDAQWTTTAAADVGACHERNRVFIVAHAARNRRHEGRPEPARQQRGSDVALSGNGPLALLPTPSTDAIDGGGPFSGRGDLLRHAVKLLTLGATRGEDSLVLFPTPEAKNAHAAGPDYARMERAGSGGHDLVTAIAYDNVNASQWGKYEAAVRRWEALTRTAPNPTEPNTKGNPRLHPPFAEWMMGWSDGWVTGLDLKRNDQLRIIGNGVVPQQAAAALRALIPLTEVTPTWE